MKNGGVTVFRGCDGIMFQLQWDVENCSTKRVCVQKLSERRKKVGSIPDA